MKPLLERILLVEDDLDIRTVAVLALAEVGGFRVTACASGEEALRRFASVRPQLLLLDIMMPGMDGPATLAAIRRLPGGAAVPVIFMTAKVQPHEEAAYRALGALEVIAKPFDPMLLPDQIRRIWEGARATASPPLQPG